VRTRIITKKSAARKQLETAILLWFNNSDPISILALAAAANNCYAALAAHIGKSSFFEMWLRQQSKGFQDQAREVRNFIKHGHKNMKGRVRYSPRLAEMLMVDSVVCHENLFPQRRLPPLMRLYFARFALEHPRIVVPERRPVFAKGIDVQKITKLSRTDFLQYFL
jgi:hypothetical protein